MLHKNDIFNLPGSLIFHVNILEEAGFPEAGETLTPVEPVCINFTQAHIICTFEFEVNCQFILRYKIFRYFWIQNKQILT